MFIVTAVNYGETCDGHTRVLGRFPDKVHAQKYVAADMASYHDDISEIGVGVEKFDLVRHEVWAEIGVRGCVWDIFDIDSLPPLDKAVADVL